MNGGDKKEEMSLKILECIGLFTILVFLLSGISQADYCSCHPGTGLEMGKVEYKPDWWLSGVSEEKRGCESCHNLKTTFELEAHIKESELCIKSAREMIKEIETSEGMNLSPAFKLISQAESCFKNWDYKGGYESMIKAGAEVNKIRTSTSISIANNTISNLQSEGYNVSTASALLSQAESVFENGEYEEAKNLAEQAKNKAEEIIRSATPAKNAIEEAETKISEANSRGSDLTQAELLLEEAEQAFENGDYSKATGLARQAKKKAEMSMMAHNILTATVIAVVIFIAVSVARILRKR